LTDADGSAPHGRTVAAFDFDGTLTRRDTLMPFLLEVCGPLAVARALAAVAGPAASALMVDLGERGGTGHVRAAAKERLFVRLLAGKDEAELVTAGQRFAHKLIGSPGLRPDTYERWQQHLAERHEVVLVSASPQLYVDPLARLLGGEAGLGTRLQVGPDGRLTGRLDGPNCRGPEKVRRLDDWLRATGSPDPTAVTVYAYGDSAGDDELLRRANFGTRAGRVRRNGS
jgi:phosphatidylglycerophosphatase C